MKLLFTAILTFSILFILSTVLAAQGAPGLPGFPVSPDPAPIDGGLGLLAAAGGAYAYKKLKGKKNREEEME